MYHPDLSKDTSDLYQQIQAAYKVLINPEARKKYDLSLGIQNSIWEK
jgi:DnaJ-class molecular chaperone